MTDKEVRLACLKLAMELVPGGAGHEEQVLALAARLYAFVTERA